MMDRYGRYQFLRIEKRDGICTITLNRPDVLNAMNEGLHRELEDIWIDVNDDDEVKAIILTGAGRAFCAGGDIRGMKEGELDPSKRMPLRNGRRLLLRMLEVEAPVIAAINGDAIGSGASVALLADVIIAAETARIGDPHVRVGLVAGDGGAVIWPLLCGVARAKQYLMTGDLMSAKEAERIGLVNTVVPKDALMAEAEKLARRFADGPTRAIRWTKYSINKMIREQLNLVLDTSLALESLTQATEDHKEALQAFVQKRQPKFKGY